MKDNNAGSGLVLNGVTIAPGVAETIVSLAAAEVDGVAGVGTAGPISSIMSAFKAGKAIPTTGISISVAEEGESLAVELTIQACYGYRLVEVADNVRTAVSDALAGQVGATVASVDVYVDGLAFEE